MNIDLQALNNIGYGLYLITSNDMVKDNGLIVNTVFQLTNDPLQLAVVINKNNYSHEIINKTKIMNVNILSTKTPFSVFEKFGFQSGRNVNKFENIKIKKTTNDLVILEEYINTYISLQVVNYLDLGTHGMFISIVTEAKTINNFDTMTYTYYHKNVKPVKKTTETNGYICKICNYIYEGDTLPKDYICPICAHPSSDFEPLEQTKKNDNYHCQVCGFEYDETKGIPELGILKGTKFEDLPDDFTCPLCGVSKENFDK